MKKIYLLLELPSCGWMCVEDTFWLIWSPAYVNVYFLPLIVSADGVVNSGELVTGIVMNDLL